MCEKFLFVDNPYISISLSISLLFYRSFYWRKFFRVAQPFVTILLSLGPTETKQWIRFHQDFKLINNSN